MASKQCACGILSFTNTTCQAALIPVASGKHQMQIAVAKTGILDPFSSWWNDASN